MSRRYLDSLQLKILLLVLCLVLNPAFFPSPYSYAEGQTKAADVDGDGKVTLDDLSWVLDIIVVESYDPKADLNGDGKVDLKDLDLVEEAYRKSPEAGGK
jgi:hypothetical protein